MSIFDEVRDRAEEKLDRMKTAREVEASAPRIAEGRKLYREQMAQAARETEASAARINANREIHQAQQAGRISPELAERRRARAAAAYESAKYTPAQRIGGMLQGASGALMREITKPRPAPAPRPATRQPAPRVIYQQPAPRPAPRAHYDPFAFWDLSPKQAPKQKKAEPPRKQEPRKRVSLLESELGFLDHKGRR